MPVKTLSQRWHQIDVFGLRIPTDIVGLTRLDATQLADKPLGDVVSTKGFLHQIFFGESGTGDVLQHTFGRFGNVQRRFFQGRVNYIEKD